MVIPKALGDGLEHVLFDATFLAEFKSTVGGLNNLNRLAIVLIAQKLSLSLLGGLSHELVHGLEDYAVASFYQVLDFRVLTITLLLNFKRFFR